MGFFGTRRGEEKEHFEAHEALERRQEALESQYRLLKTEWIDVHDRLNRMMGRLNARLRKSQAVDEGAEATNGEEQRGPTPVTGTHEQLAAMRNRRGRR